MASPPRRLLLILCVALCSQFASSQIIPAPQANRIAARPDLSITTTLPGHVPSWVRTAKDAGALAADTPLGLTILLSRSPERQAAFTQMLTDQQNPGSSSYHRWLTPSQVGELYGPTQADLDALTRWLTSRGLTVTEIAPSRVFLHVSAPASVVANVFATRFRNYSVGGETRFSVTSDPSIPAAFAAVIQSIAGLSESHLRPMHRMHSMPMSTKTGSSVAEARPEYTNGGSGLHYVTPGDFSVIFDVQPAYSAGYTGTGQKVAIIGRSRVVSTDISEFETITGLAANPPNTIIPTTGVDPGVSGDGDQGEATLDVDRVIGTAPGVQADLVVSGTAGGFDGIYVAAQYEVQTLRDPVMNISFGSCEVYEGASGVSVWDTLFSQAASEGISVFVSAADSGAATCDAQFSVPPAYQFRSINYICASSYATCVGATEFADQTNPSQYWSSTNSTGLVSALGYIPEGAWNEPAEADASGATIYVAASGGGGASIYVPKPEWQSGTGVPADAVRDVPDVSFPGAGHDGYFACYAAGDGDCAANRFEYFSGTSAAAPTMAAVTALLNQKTGGSQGNLNPLLYRVAAATPSAFHDATPASSGVADCSTATPSMCNNSTPSSTGLTGGLAGFALTTGYDQATGLGSLDITNFLNAASAPASSPAATTLSVTESAKTIADTGSVTFTATLSATAATGTVQFLANGTELGSPVVLTGGVAVTSAVPFPMAGQYLISAMYSGDSSFATATAPGIGLTVTGLTPSVTLTSSAVAVPLGTGDTFSVSVTPASGATTIPTGLVRFYLSSATESSYIATVPLVAGTVTTPAIGFSTLGSYTITAYYLGDGVYSPARSNSMTVAVQKLLPVVQVSASVTGDVGLGGYKQYDLIVTSPVQTSIAPPTGTFQLFANGVALGSPISAISGLGAQTVSPMQQSLTAGPTVITAMYSGDANWLPATGGGVSFNVLSTPPSYTLTSESPSLTLTAGSTLSKCECGRHPRRVRISRLGEPSVCGDV